VVSVQIKTHITLATRATEEKTMFDTKPPANEQLETLMDRLILTALTVTALALALVALLGSG
jgi:hypothetical protein